MGGQMRAVSSSSHARCLRFRDNQPHSIVIYFGETSLCLLISDMYECRTVAVRVIKASLDRHESICNIIKFVLGEGK